MQIIVGAKNLKLTPSLEEYAIKKFSKLEHFWSKIIRVVVELEMDETKSANDRFVVAVRLEVPGPDIRAAVRSVDMHASIDEVIPKLERQINKVKGKFLTKRNSRR